MEYTYEEAVSRIREQIDIVDIVSEEVVLKKSGSNFWGLCPFHKEKSPSFSVSPTKGFFKCFGCGAGGDAITFLMKIRNWDFNESIIHLARKYHIQLPEKKGNFGQHAELKEKAIEASKKAAGIFNQSLLELPRISPVIKYLKGRDINEEVISKYTLGLALKEPNYLYKKLKKDFSEEVLEKAGLILKRNDGGFVDRFRNRVIIPIQSENGEYVAFGARAIEDGQNPKYLNSPDTLIYNKSRILYGLYTAKEAIKEEDAIIIMEGYFDVISAQTHGIKNCVASCGTSLTSEHIKLLSRYSKSRKIYLSFDTDLAGVNATNRGAELIKTAFEGLGRIKQFDESHLSVDEDKYACEIRVISPPKGKDPDDFIREEGAEGFKEFIENAPLLIDFQINQILENKDDAKTPLEKSKLIKDLIPILKEIQNDIIRSEYVKLLSVSLKINEDAFLKEVQKTLNHNLSEEINVKRIVTKSSNIEEKTQKNLLSLYLISDSPLEFQKLSEMTKEIEIKNEKLIIVKTTIDKLILSVNNVKELIGQLFEIFNGQAEIQELISELIITSEAFNNLSLKDFLTVVEEHKNKLILVKREQEKKELKNLYNNVNNDEIESLKMQIQLRDELKNRLRTGENND